MRSRLDISVLLLAAVAAALLVPRRAYAVESLPASVTTAIISPEICDNCFDDDGDTDTDREDTQCMPPANGGFTGIGDESAAKGAVKCQKGIEKASAAFATKKLARLEKCVDLAFACIQLKGGAQDCIDKAKAACDKQIAAIPGDESKAEAQIEKACDDSHGGGLDLANARIATGLGFSAEEGFPSCVSPLTSFSDVAHCVVARHECGVERVLVAAAPRAGEMLEKLGHSPASEFPCIAASTGNTDGNDAALADATQAKTAVKCQATIKKAGLKLGKIGFKVVQKCADAAASCIQLKPGSVCQTKASTKCQATFTKLNSGNGTLAKLLAATAKKCTTATFGLTQLNDPAGLGFAAVTDPAKRCSQFTLLFPDPTGQLIECVGKQYLCEGAQMIERESPRLREYATYLGIPLDAVGF